MLEPKNDVVAEGVGGGGVKITINLGGQEHAATVIDAEPEENDTVATEILEHFTEVYQGRKHVGLQTCKNTKTLQVC